MAIVQAVCTSFKQQVLEAVHDFRASGHSFRIALYTASASLDQTTLAYSATNETSGTGYTTGGNTLTNVNPTTSGTTAFTDFADTSWSGSTITARGALIYNTTPTHTYTNPAVLVLDFGTDQTTLNGTFTISFPAAAAGTAILRSA